MKYIMKRIGGNIGFPIMDNLFGYYCSKGELEKAIERLERCKTTEQILSVISIKNYRPFREACENGHLHIAQWLFHMNPNIIIIGTVITDAYCAACERGHLHVAQWLYHIYPACINHSVISRVCYWGHLEVAQWLAQMNPNLFIELSDITIEHIFKNACSYGYLRLAQWLYQMNLLLDIWVFNEAFQNACICGHLQVAQWLYQITPHLNISAKNEYAFRYASLYNHVNVVKWLLHIHPMLNINVMTEEGSYNNDVLMLL